MLGFLPSDATTGTVAVERRRGTDYGHRMDLGSLLAALLLGFICGAIARALVPGDHFRFLTGWRSWAASTALGLLGALVGYWIFAGLLGIGDDDKFDWGGIVGALIGSILVVWLGSKILGKVMAGRSTSR